MKQWKRELRNRRGGLRAESVYQSLAEEGIRESVKEEYQNHDEDRRQYHHPQHGNRDDHQAEIGEENKREEVKKHGEEEHGHGVVIAEESESEKGKKKGESWPRN